MLRQTAVPAAATAILSAASMTVILATQTGGNPAAPAAQASLAGRVHVTGKVSRMGDGDGDGDDIIHYRPRTDCDGDRDSGYNEAGECGAASVRSSGGTLSYSGLEQLWISAGGRPGAARVAACIAEHESGGRQYATGADGEKGYWQVSPVHGSLATYNAYGNARAAVIISHDGRNWSPWTTAPACGV